MASGPFVAQRPEGGYSVAGICCASIVVLALNRFKRVDLPLDFFQFLVRVFCPIPCLPFTVVWWSNAASTMERRNSPRQRMRHPRSPEFGLARV